MSDIDVAVLNVIKSVAIPGGYSHTLTIRVCAVGQGMVFRPSSLEQGI